MSEAIDPDKAVDFIVVNAPKYAAAKAKRVLCEITLKIKKAHLMGQCDAKASNAREEYAYAHAEYGALAAELADAVEREEALKYLLEAAKLRIEVWKARIYTESRQDRTMR